MTWEDAEHDSDFAGKLEEAGSLPILEYVGYLLKKDEKMVVLASEICPEDETVRFTISIPTGIVRKIEELA